MRLRRRVFLHPGQLCASAEPVEATTILGSCVAVCLFDAPARVGGVNHFLLPHGAAASPRFGEHAVPLLVRQLEAAGARVDNLVAKLFGGACVLDALRGTEAGRLGSANVETARRLLAAAGIPVVAEDVGGERGRKVVFHTDTGSVELHQL